MFRILWVMLATERECLQMSRQKPREMACPGHKLSAYRATAGLLACRFPAQHTVGVLVLHLCSGLLQTPEERWEVPPCTLCLPALPFGLREAETRGGRKEREK